MNILISGYRGFIGSRLWVKLELSKHNIVGYDLQDGDNTCDYFKLDKIFRENNFDIVIHLAARTGVRTSKKFPEEYIFHETGPSCWNGSLHNIYVRYYFIPKFGIKKHKENAKKYINDKLLIAEEWINRYFQNKDKYIKLLIKKLGNGGKKL